MYLSRSIPSLASLGRTVSVVGGLGAAALLALPSLAVANPPDAPLRLRTPHHHVVGAVDTASPTVELSGPSGSAPSNSPTTSAPVPAGNPPPPPGSRTGVVFGDSLLWEAAGPLQGLLRADRINAPIESWGGTAPCDWLQPNGSRPSPIAAAALHHPGVIVLAFSGNAITSCMTSRAGLGSVADLYRRDVGTLVRYLTATGTWVVLVAPPAGIQSDTINPTIRALYAELSATVAGVVLVDGGEFIAPNGRYELTQPCAAFDPAGACHDGRVVVRSPDGHFCPDAPKAVLGVTQACPVYSSGAQRYARSIFGGITKLLDQPTA
jgi:hypothetical protein